MCVPRYRETKDYTVKPAATSQATTPKAKTETARPTISLQSVIVTGPDTSAFSGWGPKVAGIGSMLKNWN